MKSTDFVASAGRAWRRSSTSRRVEFADYERRLATMQETLQLVQQAYLGTAHRAVIVLEGWDTAGKGGVVRRLGWALDPRSFKVHAIAAPNGREKHLHYLQRFWERLPQHGQIVVFDRSWYGRVLVERVEGFASDDRMAPRLRRDHRLRTHAAGRRHRVWSSCSCTSRPRNSSAASAPG